jgi:hypothetical protein
VLDLQVASAALRQTNPPAKAAAAAVAPASAADLASAAVDAVRRFRPAITVSSSMSMVRNFRRLFDSKPIRPCPMG